MADKKTAEAPNEPEYEDVYIPRMHKNDDQQYVAVNGERILVKKGETVRVKRKFAEVIKSALAQSRVSEEYIRSISNG